MHGLLTDLYELTMSAGYFGAGMRDQVAVFELSVRRLPAHRDFLVAAGLAQAVEYLLGLNFPAAEIADDEPPFERPRGRGSRDIEREIEIRAGGRAGDGRLRPLSQEQRVREEG